MPPHSVDAEQSVLGGLMLDTRAWEKVADILSARDFYRQDHRDIFEAVVDLQGRGQPCDVVTVSENLLASGKKDAGQLAGYAGSLANSVASAANIAAYAEIVREKSTLRQLVDAGTTITGMAFQPEGRASREVLDESERRIFEISERSERHRSGFISIKESVKSAFERLHELYKKGGAVTGLETGYDDLDALTAGLQPSDLIIVAGRPSMGKTSFAMNIAEHAAIRHQQPVAVFSMEMAATQLATRLISSLGRINQQRLRTGDLTDEDWPRVASAVEMLSQSKIFIDETPALSPTEIRSRSRRLKREHGLGLIVVDYLQLMQVPGNKENRTQEMSEISRGLKALAKELDVPVIALSQLNRAVEQRPNKRPIMADLRESGSIEQDADVIIFIYRDEVYNNETDDKGIAEIIISKQRNGALGTIRLSFLGQYTRFESFTEDIYQRHDD